MSDSERDVRPKPLGDVMLDRSLLALVSAIGLVVFHVCLLLNVFLRPTAARVSFFVGILALCILWFRAAATVVRAWRDPSALIVRFVSIGALLLTFWPGFMVLVVTFMPPDSD
jgi:hypothetical protein